MKATPPGWPRISSALFYEDPGAAIDWLCKAFGFEVRLKIEGEGGTVEHSELEYGSDATGLGLVMVGNQGPRNPTKTSPRKVGGSNTQALCVCVDDVDAHFATARAAGAVIVKEPTTSDYGDEFWVDRTYECKDPEGHSWWFMQRLSGPKTKA